MTKAEERAAYKLALEAYRLRIKQQCGHITTDEEGSFEDGWDACLWTIVYPLRESIARGLTETFTPPKRNI